MKNDIYFYFNIYIFYYFMISTQRIQLHLSCRNLKRYDNSENVEHKINIYFKKDFNTKNYEFLGHTEPLPNELNPKFQTVFPIDYIFQSRQDIRFDLVCIYGEKEVCIGSFETTVGYLMGTKGQFSVFDLKYEN